MSTSRAFIAGRCRRTRSYSRPYSWRRHQETACGIGFAVPCSPDTQSCNPIVDSRLRAPPERVPRGSARRQLSCYDMASRRHREASGGESRRFARCVEHAHRREVEVQSLVFLVCKRDCTRAQPVYCEDLMTIELNDDDTRLLRTVLLEQAQEHLSYSDTSEVAERLYSLATRFESLVREVPNMTTACVRN
jgi:hypothetical protein